MTIERLETIAADLYKAAEEATPIIGGADKLDWMARRLEDIIEGKEDGTINDYLNCETADQVEALLETEYNDFKDADNDQDDLLQNKEVVDTEDDQLLTEDEDVVLTGTPADLTEDNILREERLEEPVSGIKEEREDKYKTDDIASKRPEKETGIKDELPDDYVDDRPDQPEYIDNEPNYFEDQPVVIIEEEIIMVDDPSEGSQLTQSELTGQSPKCGDNK